MEDEFFTEEISYTLKRKIWLEIKDIFAGVAFPFMILIIFSATLIAFASAEDLALSLIALIGGEGLLIAALVVFGRANGSHAYKNTLLNAQKRALNSSDERAVYHTGEYALWKAAVIALICSAPFILFQIIELAAPNSFTGFCLRYICAWAYYPFSYLGEDYQALNFILILLPVGVHMLGYYLGKRKVIKNDEYDKSVAEREKGRKKK